MATPAASSVAPVLRLAVLSRLLTLTLILLFRLLFQPYDTSASLNPPCLSSSSSNQSSPSDPVLLPRIGAAIEGSVVWDSVHFVRIAECGYEYEHSFAFLPLLPVSLALLSRSVFAPLVPIIGYRAVLALSGYVLSNVSFVIAAVYFYRLSLLMLKDSAASLRASALFCFNPASIFYSSIYSESLYALCSLGGIFYVFSGANSLAMLLLALSSAARSNGAVNAGYFCFLAILRAYDAIIQERKTGVAVQAIFVGVVCSICIVAPFVIFQAYGYLNICVNATSNEIRPWCKARIPNLYGFLQSHYWGVGFLRYFQVKQLPNFLLASPMLALAVCSIIRYTALLPQVFWSKNMNRERTYGSMLSPLETSSDAIFNSKDSFSFESLKGDLAVRQRKHESREKGSVSLQDSKLVPDANHVKVNQGYHSILVLPFILHLGFLTFTAFFVMHVQVAGRFLSASPPIYWFASYVLVSHDRASRRMGNLIWVYFIAYILLGTLLFSNFYPFT